MVGMLFFGIEELGVQIEEPFSILPLEDFVASIESAGACGNLSVALPHTPHAPHAQHNLLYA